MIVYCKHCGATDEDGEICTIETATTWYRHYSWQRGDDGTAEAQDWGGSMDGDWDTVGYACSACEAHCDLDEVDSLLGVLDHAGETAVVTCWRIVVEAHGQYRSQVTRADEAVIRQIAANYADVGYRVVMGPHRYQRTIQHPDVCADCGEPVTYSDEHGWRHEDPRTACFLHRAWGEDPR